MNRQFPALRGLAIILVVLNHTTYMGTLYPTQWGYPPIEGWLRYVIATINQLGVFAVPIFLFLSGCFFTYASQTKSIKQSYKIVWSSLKNVVWPYIIWSLVFYIVIFFLNDQKYTPLEYLKNLIVGYPYDFVPLLIFYYLISPVLVRLSKKYGLIVIVVIAAYQFYLINLLNPGITGFNFPEWARYFRIPVLSTNMSDWALFFPLGIIYSLHAKSLLPQLRKFRWVIVLLTGLFFILTVLNFAMVLNFPFAQWIAPVLFMGIIPVIRRESIPFVRQLELVGKKAYGLYLTNLTVLYITLTIFHAAIPAMLGMPLVLFPILFILALGIPLVLMSSIERLPNHGVYRYVFG
jgi:peptidoglycan/LPS O-acetylase OafA/YrhL